MNFKEALEAMKKGEKVKLPSWGGYWCWDAEKGTIMMHCRPRNEKEFCGPVLDIRETENVVYTLENIASDEWIIADENNTPVLGGLVTFSFGEALKYLKRGFKVARKGWNGKGMFLWLKPAAEIKKEWCKDPFLAELAEENGGSIQALGTICMFTHDSSGRKAILTGWLASQSDMLLEDWEIVS